MTPRKFLASIVGVLALGGAGFGVAALAASTTGTNTVCATVPARGIGIVGGAQIGTVPAASACKTVTYTIPTVTSPPVTVTRTVTTTTPVTTPTQTTTTPTGTSTTPPPPPPPPPPNGTVNCPLTAAAASCWASSTGVQGSTGFTEAQIMANPSGTGFTVHAGDLVITKAQSNTTVDHEWITGCVSIADGANNVTLSNDLITPEGSTCSGDDAAGSAINTGQGSSIGEGTLVEDTTVDGTYKNTPTFGDHSVGITVDGGDVLRVNLFGYGIGYLTNANTAAHPALFSDDYGHDYVGCAHDDGTWFDSAHYVTFNHGYIVTNDLTQSSSPNGEGCSTAALAGGDDGGSGDVQDHVVIEDSYGEGVTGEDTHWGCGATNSSMINNVLSTDAKDTTSGFESLASDTWSGNVDSNGNPVGRPDSC